MIPSTHTTRPGTLERAPWIAMTLTAVRTQASAWLMLRAFALWRWMRGRADAHRLWPLRRLPMGVVALAVIASLVAFGALALRGGHAEKVTTPQITYGNGTMAHERQPVTFGVGVRGAQTTYRWTFGDGAAAAGASPTHTYAAYGYYTVTVVATNAVGSSATTQRLILVAPVAPKVVLIASQDRYYSYQLTADAGKSLGAGLHFYWDFGDGKSAEDGGQRIVQHIYQLPGAYQLTLTVIDLAG
ncbi:MAG TPA: PKD domain-containing protein, partial [Ktedonobacterales bacterium]